MKNLLILLVALALGTTAGCSNKPAKAQALLLEAMSYADGGSTEQAQEKAMKMAAAKGRIFNDKLGCPSREEMVILVGSEVCDQILAKYPETPAAIKASELKHQIAQKLQTMLRIRIQSMYTDPSSY